MFWNTNLPSSFEMDPVIKRLSFSDFNNILTKGKTVWSVLPLMIPDIETLLSCEKEICNNKTNTNNNLVFIFYKI